MEVPSGFGNDLITTLVAIYGAFVASVALIVSLIEVLRDKGRAKLSAFVAQMVQEGIPADAQSEQRYLYVSAVNSGRRPLLLQSLVAEKRWEVRRFWCLNGGYWFKSVQFANAALEESKIISDHFPITRDLIESFRGMSGLSVVDSTGRKYRLPSGQFRKLRRAVLALEANLRSGSRATAQRPTAK